MTTTTYEGCEIAYRYILNSFGKAIIFILIAFTLMCTYEFKYLYENNLILWAFFVSIVFGCLGYLYGLTPVEIPNLVNYEASLDVDEKRITRALLAERQVMQ